MNASRRRTLGWLALSFVLAILALLFFFSPDEHGFYPRCQLYALTGLQCPGCGGLRAAHQLLHGHVAAAFQLNPLFVLTLAGLAVFALVVLLCRLTGRRAPNPFHYPAFAFLILGALVTFAILRNL